MSHQETPIFTRTFDFLSWLLPVTNKFPRVHRHTFTRRLLDAAFDLRERLETDRPLYHRYLDPPKQHRPAESNPRLGLGLQPGLLRGGYDLDEASGRDVHLWLDQQQGSRRFENLTAGPAKSLGIGRFVGHPEG